MIFLGRKRYPVKRSEYARAVGRLLPHRIGQILKELGLTEDAGFRVWINCSQANDVDLKIYFRDDLILVAEILNWSFRSRLSDKRSNNIVSNLLKYDCARLLIYTCLDERSIEYFTEKNIHLIGIGYQLLPKHFYKHFSKLDQVDFREIDSKKTKKDIRLNIQHFLKRTNFCTEELVLIKEDSVAFDGGKQQTLLKFIPRIKKGRKRKRKIKKKRETEECPNRIVIVCNQDGRFYACSYALEEFMFEEIIKNHCRDYPNCEDCELYPCSLESDVEDEIRIILYYGISKFEARKFDGVNIPEGIEPLLWQHKENWIGKCECKPSRILDGIIIERENLNQLSKYEPCKFRCRQLQFNGECKYIRRKKVHEELAQGKLEKYIRKRKRRKRKDTK